MACATLKRSPDFDPVHNQGNPRKRQRCGPVSIPMSIPTITTTSRSAVIADNSLAGICSKLTPEMMAAGIREEIHRLHRMKMLHFNPKLAYEFGDNASRTTTTISNCATMTDRDSMMPSPPPNVSDSLMESPSSPPNCSSSFPSSMRDKPLFTFRQVGMICERLINERENQLREEYERFLNSKLSEQYEAFVRFSNDQLRQRFEEMGTTASYLS